ncbi:aminopeptidase N [Rothia sp. ZJ1223]|uniref:aminopeptidase N n=1 Tax=Rothia sp. ZJ1223 TaxID=2811098 RepID=UPI00195EA542|nr:aminopeptidase N [Rothia sp. ZJ1223]
MNNENLTREEAAQRAELLTVDTYDVHVDLTHAADTSFASYPTATTVKFTVGQAQETFIDYIHQSIDSVKLNGEHLNLSHAVEGSRIIFTPLPGENVLTIHGRSFFSRSGEGLHRYIDPKDGKVYLYTQYEPADCRRVFPNFEQPDLKAIFNFRVTAPSHWVVSSNAQLERTLEDPSDSSVSKRIFAPTKRISTYITTLLAGEYHVERSIYTPTSSVNSGKIPLVAYCRQSLAEHFDAQNIFAVTQQGLDFFQDLFDYPYPFEKYEQAFVPEYNLGAMENPGLVTFTEGYIYVSGATKADLEARANVICHEMSHMWFGDLVTMKWWDDLWLKESFADFMGTLGSIEANGFEDAWVTFANRRKAWAYYQDQLPTTHPIVADIPHLEAAKQNFDGITYAKGASALKQLVAFVGFESFIAAARTYFKRHEYQNTTLDDFLAVLDEACNRDVFTWAHAWLRTSGLSTLRTERVRTPNGGVELYVHQELPAGVPAQLGRPHQLKCATFTLRGDALTPSGTIALEIPAGESVRVKLELSDADQQLVSDADVLLLNAEDLSYAKVILDEDDGRSLVMQRISTLEDALTRGLMWGSLWNQVRDALLPAADFVQMVASHVAHEASATLLASITSQSQSAIKSYAPANERAALWSTLYDAFAQALQLAAPGSDSQLILLRATLSCAAHTDRGIEFAQDVARGALENLEGTAITGLEGINYTQSLGWSALIALASHDRVEGSVLEQGRAFNPSATAERGFAFATAARPLASVKKAAFEAVMTNAELSNEILTATANGYQAGPHELREDDAQQYFDLLTRVWSERSIVMATRVIDGLYPDATFQDEPAINDHPAVALGEQWLADHEAAPSALRRKIIEHVDDARRSLTAQAARSTQR